MASFSHVDSDARPTMVDVGDKSVTKRTATAQTRVKFPHAVAEEAIPRTEEVVATESDMRRALIGGMDPIEAYNRYGKF